MSPVLLALAGCVSASAPAPAPAPVQAPATAQPRVGDAALAETHDERALAEAEAMLARARERLLSTMIQRTAQRPPPEGEVRCSVEEQALLEVASPGVGARVGRSSLRLRDPANAPPPWVGEWLVAQGERPAAGVQGFARIDDAPEGRVARALAPLEAEPRCLACHGDPSALPLEVRTALGARFPDDRATGYAAGDLRGALWAEVLVTP